MPIPTDTFWNIKRLNWVFAVSAIALTAVTGWSIIQDWNKDWRRPQRSGRAWESALATDRLEAIQTDEHQKALAEIQRKLDDTADKLKPKQAEIDKLTAQVRALESDKATREFSLNNIKASLSVTEAHLQDAITANDSARVKALTSELNDANGDVSRPRVAAGQEKLFAISQSISERKAELRALTSELDELKGAQTKLNSDAAALRKKIESLDPKTQGGLAGLLGGLSSEMRNAPLLDFVNPSEKVQQIVLPDVQTDVAFMKITTVDRCVTCHVNIGKKEFSAENILNYLEEQTAIARQFKLASALPKPTATATQARPGAVAMPDFWQAWALTVSPDTIKKNAGRLNAVTGAVGKTVTLSYDGAPLTTFKYNPALNDAKAAPSTAPTTAPAIDGPAQNQILVALIAGILRGSGTYESGKVKVEVSAPDAKALDAPRDAAMRFVEELRKGVEAALPATERRVLLDRYRFALADVVNPARRKQGLAALDASAVVLAHPRLDLYVDADSRHPQESGEKSIGVGCTSCHDGSGQETDFVLAAHTARPIMVDQRTGVPVPLAVLPPSAAPHEDQRSTLGSMLEVVAPTEKVIPTPVAPLHISLGDGSHEGHDAKGEHDTDAATSHGGGHGEPGPAPFVDPVTGRAGKAITQFEYWRRRFEPEAPRSFALVYHEWDRPMLPPKFIEANCVRCHTNVYDIKDQAPTVYAGRRLFAEVGCVNCHQMDSIPPEAMPKDAIEDGTDPRLVMANGRVKVGPSLTHVTSKLSPAFINTWIWAPKAFRPSTRMPHFFMLENSSSDEELRRTRQEARAITEYLVQTADALNPAHPISAGIKGSAEAGQAIFNAIGCKACHVNLNDPQAEKRNNQPVTLAEKWIVTDLMKGGRLKSEMAAHSGKDPDDKALRAEAERLFDAMTYNERQMYAAVNLEVEPGATELRKYSDGTPRPQFITVGPELSAVGTKLTSGQTPDQARQWLFDWLKEPRHYSNYSIMPQFRLNDQQAIDLTEYLLAQTRRTGLPNDPWQAGLTEVDSVKQRELVALFLRSKYSAEVALQRADDDKELTENAIDALKRTTSSAAEEKAAVEAARKRVAALSKDEKRMVWLGKKLISHYGCMSCHAINGTENLTSPCANLSDWGQKGLDKLDFGYLDHHKLEGLPPTSSIPMVNGVSPLVSTLSSAPSKSAQPNAKAVSAGWPSVDHKRTAWIAQKLKNSRIYDRGKALLEPDPTKDDVLLKSGKPYDKLKMPTFYLNDEQVHQIVTFVISNRDKLVSDRLLARANNERMQAVARGRELTERFNCVSCHWIERNKPQIQQFFKADEMLTKAPPPLRGQGNKVQFDWLFNFFRNVIDLRPLLYQHNGVRMPSFAATDEEWTAITHYFSAVSNKEAADLKRDLDLVIKYVDAARAKAPEPLPPADKPWPGDDWYRRDEFRLAAERLYTWAVRDTLNMKEIELDPTKNSPDDLGRGYRAALFKARFTMGLYDSPYPFVDSGRPGHITEERLKLGEEFMHQMQCLTCHYLGDPNAPGAVKDPKAPNLALTYERLQRRWVRAWVQEPAVIQPGTSMPPFLSGISRFHPSGLTWSEAAGRPPEEIEFFNARYGKTADEQADLLLDYLYTAGARGLTTVQAPSEKLPKAPPPPAPTTAAAAEPKGSGAATPVAAPVTPAAPSGEKAPPAPAGKPNVSGKVIFKGKPPEQATIDMSAVKECAAQHTDAPPDESLVVNENGTLRNVIVSISAGLPEGQSYSPPAEPARLDQRGCMYEPHVLAMQTGQKLVITNSDQFLHNVHSLAQQNPSFNFGQPNVDKAGKAIDPMRTPELFKVKCDVHPWMGAHVQVFEHPYFAVSGADGSFALPQPLPAGTYTVTAWHEKLGESKKEFTVEDGKPVTLSFEFGG